MIKKTVPMGTIGHLPTLGITADLPNTQKQTQKERQNGETKKHVLNERTEKNLKKKS